MTMRTDYEKCIQACLDCANACDACVIACRTEQDPSSLARCIKLLRECADTCRRAVAFMARADAVTDHFADRLRALCAELCEACASECRRHKLDLCQASADACEACAQACRERINGVAA